jgi:hypothetical protein
MAKKEKYKGPTPEQMDRAARMMEANIPPGSSPKLKDTNPMPVSKEEADKQRMEMEKAMLKGANMGGMGPMQGMKKGGKVKAPTMTFETYTKTGKKAGLKTVPAKKMSNGGTASSRADGIAVKGKTRGKIC